MYLIMAYGAELVWAWSKMINERGLRKVQKVDGGDSWLVLSFSGNNFLMLSWGSQSCGLAFITEENRRALLSAAKQVPTITGAAKSYIAGTEFINAEHIRRDRIIALNFKKTVGAGFTNTRKIIIELVERYANILITDEDMNIIETAKHIHPADNPFRSVLPGQAYVLPPEFHGISLESWLESPSAVPAANIAGFGKKFMNFISDKSPDEKMYILSKFYGNNTIAEMRPIKIGNYFTVLPTHLSVDTLFFPSLQDMSVKIALEPLLNVSTAFRKKKIAEYYDKEISRREKQSLDIERLLYKEQPNLYKIYGEAIMANLWNIKKGASSANLSFYSSDGTEESVEVKLNPSITPSQNAAAFFAKYKKIVSAQERAKVLLESVKTEKEYLQEELMLAMRSDDNESITMIEDELGLAKRTPQRRTRQKNETKLPPHKRFEFEHSIVFAGLSAKGNRYVTFKYAAPNDVWFHAQGIPGAHVVLRFKNTPDDTVRSEMIDFCSSLAAYYSKSGEDENIRVDYTEKRYVSPIKGSIASVTYKEFKSIIGKSSFWEKFLTEKS